MLRWSTEDVCESERAEYWVEAICAAFLTMRARPRRSSDFFGEVTRQVLGPLALMRVSSTAQDVQRLEIDISSSCVEPFYLIGQFSGPWMVSQAGRHEELAAGELVLVDGAMPYAFHCPGAIDNVSIEIPRSWLSQWLLGPEPMGATRLNRDAAFEPALRETVSALRDPRALARGASVAQALGSLLQLGLEPRCPPVAREARWQRINDVLGARCREPGLTASNVAADADCSVASLHRLFMARGGSFAAALMQARLGHARRMLKDPGFQTLTVFEVGQRCGFRDASHFVRAFVRHQGCTPGSYRLGSTVRRA